MRAQWVRKIGNRDYFFLSREIGFFGSIVGNDATSKVSDNIKGIVESSNGT